MDLHRKALMKEHAYRGDGIWEQDLRDIEHAYFANGGDFLVGEDSGSIIAMGALRRIDQHTAEITRMRVAPEHQGKGFGKLMLRELEKRAQDMNYTCLVLETDERLVAARALYTKSGYVRWKDEILDGYPCMWYKKTF